MESHTMIFEPRLSEAEFDELCQRYSDMQFELTKEGVIRMMTPAGNESSEANSEIIAQLRAWWKTHRRGRVFDSNTLFVLPDGSKLGPDAAYITDERLRTIPREALRGFAPICPNFVIELLSRTDSEEEAIEKMRNWIANGVELGWLINPYKKHCFVFRPQNAFTTGASGLHSSDDPVAGFELDLTEVWSAFD
jgi:Uma2 family endonuclease